VALTKKPARPFLLSEKHVSRMCFSSSTEPPYSGDKQKLREGKSYKSNNLSELQTQWPSSRDTIRQHDKRITRAKNPRRKRSPSLVSLSPYSYRMCSGKEILLSYASGSAPENASDNRNDERVRMQSIDASALLDPLKYCKRSSRLHSGSRSISGTEQARRLLSGKRDFLLAASKLNKTPVLLDGHGVPTALFQHCIDMAGALLRHYGPDIVECSFRNNRNNTNSKTPGHVRVRRRDAKNESLPPPSTIDNQGESDEERNQDEVDWDYNLTLYLTVMERLAKNLGQVFEISSFPKEDQMLVSEMNAHSSHEHYKYDEIDHDVDASSTQFSPQWNVGIFEGAYFDFEAAVDGTDEKYNHPIRPFPVVEFVPDPNSPFSGRVLIRLQGYPVANQEFDDTESPRQRQEQSVSLIFDARIQNPTAVVNFVNS